ncbi:NUDIX domain-containing protein [Rhodophyticola sp. CCM32]|uniref:NUDIX hydrolase n=1 Tax=Rhodophyticola sp. CCM32 TaxID=2916397 RepID=UPI00107F38E9|nr:NUDIX hydrolase [Rhodophyticola sp. CCM32]QBY01982.1 NUDIX domain-containing protein [Rhodophyticola sp. CCM32]
MNRRFGPRPDPNRQYTPRAGVYAIITSGEGILATFQEQPTPEFQLPGGGIDPGESVLAALHREVMEETGYHLRSPRRMGMFHRFTYMPDYDLWAQKQCHIYLASLGRQIAAPTEPGHWPVFLPWEEAANTLAVSGDRYFVARAMAGLNTG